MDSNSAACWPCQGFSYFCFLPVDVCNRPASTPGHSGRKPYIYQWDEGESPSSPAEDIQREKQSLKLTLSPTVNRFSHYSNWLINIFKCLVLMFDASSREWHVIWSLCVITVIIIELLWFLFWSRSCWTCSQSQKTVDRFPIKPRLPPGSIFPVKMKVAWRKLVCHYTTQTGRGFVFLGCSQQGSGWTGITVEINWKREGILLMEEAKRMKSERMSTQSMSSQSQFVCWSVSS